MEAANIADEILRNPPIQRFLTISHAWQWRLQRRRVIERAGQEEGILAIYTSNLIVSNSYKAKIEYGVFQTPLELAELVCQKLVKLNINPKLIIEPTCGTGNFIETSLRFSSSNKMIEVENNQNYLRELKEKQRFVQDGKVEIIARNFFQYGWIPLLKNLMEMYLY